MNTPSLFALVDCNNFYASCERVFNPRLKGEPIVVLSNNDGCIVARSNETKALGIKMGVPFFEMKKLVEKHRVRVFSSNYALYGDMSQRVFTTLSRFTPEMEIYSIDEAFLNLSGFDRVDLTTYAHEMRDTVKKWTGIPISVGIAETKTLAKIANHVAKHSPGAAGVCDLSLPGVRDKVLPEIPVQEIWGIGGKLAKRLVERGVTNAAQFRDLDEHFIRKWMGVVGARMVMELRGVSCLTLESCPPPRKGITCSRSFGRPVLLLDEMKEAVTAYVSRAAVKLRQQGSSTKCLTVFLMTNHFRETHPLPNKQVTMELPVATDNTRELIKHAIRGVETIFNKGWRYSKAGVIFTDLTPTNQGQHDMFDAVNRTRSDKLMATVDQINRRMGRKTLHFLAQGQTQPWSGKCNLRSPGYTNNWNELAQVR